MFNYFKEVHLPSQCFVQICVGCIIIILAALLIFFIIWSTTDTSEVNTVIIPAYCLEKGYRLWIKEGEPSGSLTYISLSWRELRVYRNQGGWSLQGRVSKKELHKEKTLGSLPRTVAGPLKYPENIDSSWS